MGGRPLTALSIIAFPIEKLSHRVMNRMLQGGIDKLKEAGVVLLGGHSIKDREVKFGFAVTGTINPSRIITNSNARPGDVLILTKPLGTGIISFARQLGKAPAAALESAGRSMIELNKAASEVMTGMGVRAATDVTGFGLAGHLGEMVVQSRVSAEVWTDSLPVFDGVLELITENLISGAVERNREFASKFVNCSKNVGEVLEMLVYDPQTSGGLLISVAEKKSAELLKKLKSCGVEHATVIGRIQAKPAGRILLRKKPKA
jgi:selenide,water dikinase